MSDITPVPEPTVHRWTIRGQGLQLWPKVVEGPSFEDEEEIEVAPLGQGTGTVHSWAYEQLMVQRDQIAAEVERLRYALERIADPEWASVYPPDVFAETKKIARKALDAR